MSQAEQPIADSNVDHIDQHGDSLDSPDHADQQFATFAQRSRRGLLGEWWDFVRHNKKWWLIPILAVLLLASVLVILAGTGAAPFIYTLF
ncbi:MAG TPA: DUF5989 family protein [Pirellulales bacterium]|jgi:hypothetical protein